MAKEKAESPVSRLMGLAGKSKSKYYQAIVLAVIGVASGFVPYIC